MMTGFYPYFLSAMALTTLIQGGRSEAVFLQKQSHRLTSTDDSVTVGNRAELVAAVAAARPGTTILIAAGKYQGGLHFSNLRGEKGKPITISGADEENPPIIEGRTAGIQLTQPSYVNLKNLVIQGSRGNGINIDDGGNEKQPASHLLLRGIVIQDIGPKGNHDGIKLSGVDHFRIENCTVERWGESGSAIDMVGCHSGVIHKCEFEFRSDIFGNGVQTKGGSQDIKVSHCRFENAGGRAVNIGGSTGKDYLRPRSPGFEAKDITVEDCTFIGSMAPVVFVGVDGAVVKHNTIFQPTRWVVRILQENQSNDFVACRNGKLENNLIVFSNSRVRSVVNIGGGTQSKTFLFANNHWYCQDAPSRSSRLNLPTVETNGTYGVDPLFKDVQRGDYRFDRTKVKNAGVRDLIDKGR